MSVNTLALELLDPDIHDSNFDVDWSQSTSNMEDNMEDPSDCPIKLPSDILAHCFQFLDLSTLLCHAILVCRQFARAARKPFAWHTVSLFPFRAQLQPVHFITIYTCWSRLESLTLTGPFFISDKVLRILSRVTLRLRYVCLSDCRQLTGPGIVAFVSVLPSLTHLDCSRTSLDDTSLSNLALAAPQLLSLDVEGSFLISDNGLAALFQHCTSLRELNVSHIPSISDRTLAYIETYRPPLRSLNVNGCRLVTDTGIAILMGAESVLRSLRHLYLSETSVQAQSIRALSRAWNYMLKS